MKNLLFVLLVLSVTVNAQVPSYVPTNGLVAYYPFNGNANDASGNGNNGTVNGATLTTDRFGDVGKAYSFDGNSNYIETALNYSSRNFTIQFWIKPGAYRTYNGQIGGVALSTLINGPDLPNSFPNNWEFQFKYLSDSAGLGNGFNGGYLSKLPQNQWAQIVCVFDSISSTVKQYKDGILNQVVPFVYKKTSNRTIFGGRANSPVNCFFNGTLDDIAIYNRALSQSEITGLYNAGTNTCLPSYLPTTGLVGYWPFCGNANDASGNGNNGTVNGATLTTDRFGDVGKAYSFDGINDVILLPSTVSDFTISLWFNFSNLTNQFSEIYFYNDGSASFVQSGNYIYVRKQNQIITSIDISTSVVNQNQWVHFVVKYNSNQNTLECIVNNQARYYSSPTTGGAMNNLNDNLFHIGGRQFNNTNFFHGKLDDIAIYNRALSSQEISNLYSSSTPCIANITNNDTTICRGSSVTLNATAINSATVTDINGNVYPSVNIGAQTWMQKNLNVSKYKNGDIIPQVTDPTEWANLTTGAWCWLKNDSATFSATYGKLYNWYAVNDPRGLSPSGWHVSTESDWNKLMKYIDLSADTSCLICSQSTTAGGAIKSSTGWFLDGNGSNTFGFNGLPSCIRRGDGGFYLNTQDNSCWWSANGYETTNAWSRNLEWGSSNLYKNQNVKSAGFSVRAVRNTPTYLWSTGATTQAISVSPTVTTKYYCTVSDGVNTCKDSVTVTVSTITTNLITADTIKVCGTSTTISATTGLTSYAWSNGANTASTTVTSSGWYKCTASNGACTVVDSVYVSLFNPKITQNDTTVCAGAAVQLQVAGDSISSNRFFIQRIGLTPYAYINANEWNYISITKDVNRNTNVYFNGQLVSRGTFSNELFNHVILYIGASYYTGFANFFKGWLDELRISNRARTSTEILSYYNQNLPFSNDSNTVALWRFNENSGNSFLNERGGNGTLFNGALFQSGKFGNAVYFDGINDYGDCNFNMIENNYTIDAWIKLDGNVPLGSEGNYIEPHGLYNTETGFKGEKKSQYTSILWSTNATTQSITVNPTATTSYIATVSNGINTCKDTVKITVANITSLSPTTIFGAVDVCSAIGTDTASIPVNYTINRIANAASYVWTVPAGATLLSGQGDTSIFVRFSASFVSGAITVKSVSTCNISSALKSVTVYKRVAAAPTAIQKEFTPTSILATTNVTGLVSEVYRIKKVLYATSYNWYLNRGTSATITHINAAGVNDTAVIVTFGSCFVKDTLSVKSVTPCSISAAKTVIMSSSTTPATVAGITTVGGDFAVCIGSSKTFTAIASTPTTTQVRIASYRWTKPLNTVITSANSDSSSITVSFNAGFTGGNITAKGVSSCGVIGTTAFTLIMQYLPPTPLSIGSSTNSYNACINSSVTYTALVGALTTAQAPASVFRWTRPNNTTITSASFDSSSITVSFNTGYTGGVISVKGQSRCGAQSAARAQALTHTGCALGTKTSLPITTTNTTSFEVSLYPNPTTNEFKLLIKNNAIIGSNKPSKAIIKVIDIQGRMIKSFTTNTNQVTAIGNELKAGVYMVEVRMGEEVKVIRAVKF